MYDHEQGLKKVLDNERLIVEKGLKQAVEFGSIWHVISAVWFEKWKLYVDFANSGKTIRSDEEIEALRPGPIDNSSIKGTDEELKPGLVEYQDFVLLPKFCCETLYRRYNGGPQFVREAVKIGGSLHSIIQVALYRVRFEVYYCDKDGPYPNKEQAGRYTVEYFDKNAICKDIISKLKLKFRCYYDCRWWIKESREHHSADSIENGVEDLTTEVTAKKARVGRLLNSDYTDWENNWRLLRSIPLTRTAAEIVGTSDCVELILESCSLTRPKDEEWPRGGLLLKWKNDLRKDDVVDASDKTNKWFEAVVKQVDADGVHVHFRSWSAKFDEVIPTADIGTRIQPLHSKTQDRGLWQARDQVEIRVPDTTEVAWMGAKISDVDESHGRITVEYSMKERAKTLESLKKKPLVSSDDARKKLDAEWKGTGSGNVSDEEGSSKKKSDDEPDIDEDEIKEVVFDLMSEDVCAMYTHTKKPAVAASSHASAMAMIKNNYSASSSSYTYSAYGTGSSYFDFDKHTKGTPPVVGAVGLQNLGNTCFMNSILQCLSNTESLTNIFRNDEYVSQINKNNPLGHGGKLASVYAKLIKDMWNDGYTKIVPREFKTTIGEFQPQFAGYDQQDSQELMGFLLDGLHEDLNRVNIKPHVTKIESRGRDDSLISAESWRRYLLRNDSELVDRCFGQLKSHVTCVNCGNESVTFDEYSSISLPIPIRSSKTISIVVQLLPLGSAPFVVDIEVEISDTMSSLSKILYEALVKAGKMPPLANHASSNNMKLSPSTSVGCDVNRLSVGTPTSDSMDVSKDGTPLPVAIDDNEYELVDRSTLPSGEVSPYTATASYVVVSDNTTDSSNSQVSTAPVEASPMELSKAPFFHFLTVLQGRISYVYKCYNPADAANTAIQAYSGRTDQLIAVQLEQTVPEPKSIQYSYNTSIYSSLSKKEPLVAEVPSPYTYIDVVQGVKVVQYNYGRLELHGYPVRVAIPKVGVTNRDVHNIVWTVMRRFINEQSTHVDSKIDTRPYEVMICGRYGNSEKRTVPIDDSAFEMTIDGDMVCAMWMQQHRVDGEYDFDQLKELIPPRNYYSSYSSDESDGKSKHKINIFHCLDKFIEREQLADTETLYCSKCKQHLAPIKKMDIWAAPDILIFHLKRFQYGQGQYFVHREKISELIDFPIEGLDLRHYVKGRQVEGSLPIYDLYAVSHHSGGLGGGHYTATCQNFVNKQWYNFNDSSVSESDPSRAVNGTAYVLFYKRRGAPIRWSGIIPSSVPIVDPEE